MIKVLIEPFPCLGCLYNLTPAVPAITGPPRHQDECPGCCRAWRPEESRPDYAACRAGRPAAEQHLPQPLVTDAVAGGLWVTQAAQPYLVPRDLGGTA